MTGAFLTGLGLGLAVAAQVGPVSLLVVRTVLRGATLAGAAIGLGAAVVDVGYAAMGSAGAAGLLALPGVSLGLGLLGAAVLGWLGVSALRAARRPASEGGLPDTVAGPGRALRTGLVVTASNPTTIASWAAIFLAAGTAGVADGPARTGALLAGIGLGTAAWFATLTGAVHLLRARVTPRALAAVDVASGLLLLGFGAALAVRAVQGG